MNQTDTILDHLKSGRTITPLEALNLYGCFRLGARIYDLERSGHSIESRMVDVGNGKRVAEYRLSPAKNPNPPKQNLVDVLSTPSSTPGELFTFFSSNGQKIKGFDDTKTTTKVA